MFLIKHTWGTPARGEVREFYRQLAHHCKSNFCDGAGPVFDLQTPAGQSVMILLGGKVEDMHRALDGIMELLAAAGMVPASPYPDRHFVPTSKPGAPISAATPDASAGTCFRLNAATNSRSKPQTPEVMGENPTKGET
jgi:hypothetical protein